MPTFSTPEPIVLTIDVAVANIDIVAGERADTIVEVTPTDPAKKGDVSAAQQTTIDFTDGALVVKGPRPWRQFSFRRGESIDIHVELPSGSRVRGDAAVATLRATGRLGACNLKNASGDMHLDHVGPLSLKTGSGDVSVDAVAGPAEIVAASGAVRVDRVEGNAVVRNANGDTTLGAVTGDVRVSGANGRISVGHAASSVVAKTANGSIVVGDAASGLVVAETAMGRVEIGVREGVPAWLDLNTFLGHVHNELEASSQPARDEPTIEVRARTACGDIVVRRAVAAA